MQFDLAHYVSRLRLTKKTLSVLIVGSLVTWIGLTIVATVTTLFLLREKQFFLAQQSAKVALPFVHLLSNISQSENATIETWEGSLEILVKSTKIFDLLEKSSTEGTISLKEIYAGYIDVEPSLSKLATYAPQAPILQKTLDADFLLFLKTVRPQIPHLGKYLQTLSIGDHTWLLIFQNSEELRANGGFLGSYALATISNGTVNEVIIEDVYDTDGQFTGFVEPPPGVKEYLSGNNGLRLPDANWAADFPTSARQILQFFALGNKQSIDGVIAINLETVREIVKIVEPLWLPDYNTHVTGANLSSILREERGVFFPGSQDKKQILRHVWSQLKVALSTLSLDNQKQLVQTLFDQLEKKQIQIYTTHPDLEILSKSLGFAGEVTSRPNFFSNTTQICAVDSFYPTCPTDYFYLVESNVGVNKTNRLVERTVHATLTEYRSTISIQFKNNNPPLTADEIVLQKTPGADHNAYVNYQRVLVPAEYTLQFVAVNNIPVEKIDETIITTSSGEKFREVGFLLTVTEQQSQSVSIEFTHPQKALDSRIITIQKQPGVSPYTVTVEVDSKQRQILLEKDVTVVIHNPERS